MDMSNLIRHMQCMCVCVCVCVCLAQAADRVGLAAVKTLRTSFDIVTGYGPNMTEAKWLQVRCMHTHTHTRARARTRTRTCTCISATICRKMARKVACGLWLAC